MFGSIEVSKLSESPVRYTIDVGGVDFALGELELAQILHVIRGAEVEASVSSAVEFEPESAALEVSASDDDSQDVDEHVDVVKSSK